MFLSLRFNTIALCIATSMFAAAVATGPAVAAVPNGSSHCAPYKGRVIAKTGLKLRQGPTRSHKVVGSLKYGEVVKITCKKQAERIDGNPRWYRIANKGWAFASARYIKNIGPAPTLC